MPAPYLSERGGQTGDWRS